MAIPRFLADLGGTALARFRVGGPTGLFWKVISSAFVARNSADSADAPVTGSELRASGDQIVINSDSAGTGADWKITVKRPTTGMTADWLLTLPPDDGSPSQVLQTDGSGVTTWVTPSSGSPNGELVDQTAFAFGTTSPLTMFTKPAGSKVDLVTVYVDTAFTGGTAPTMSIGITGTTSKYAGTTDIDLTAAASYELDPGIDVVGGTEALIATLSLGGSTAGAGRIQIKYSTPT